MMRLSRFLPYGACLAWVLGAASLPPDATAQAPSAAWQRSYGGGSNDLLFSLEQTLDGGLLAGGYSYSPSGSLKSAPNFGFSDFWVVRTDARGERLWDASYGGTSDDVLVSTRRVPDGGFLLGGTSLSESNGIKTAPSFGLRDYWVVRVDDAGEPLWDRAYGGSASDYLQGMTDAGGGGFLLGGYSFSNTNAIKTSPSQGLFDYWVVRVDASGNPLWDAAFGGGGHDYLTHVEPRPPHGFILGGYSYSGVGGNKSAANTGGADYWVVCLNASGTKQWDASYGGTGDDVLRVVRATGDGGYLLGGQSASAPGAGKSAPRHGGADYWVVKIDANGVKQWDQSFGGAAEDQLWAMIATVDGGAVLGGWSNSGVSAMKTSPAHGLSDYWVVGMDGTGESLWQASFGGAADEVALALAHGDGGGLFVGGYSFSGAEGTKSTPELGGGDYWLIHMTNAPAAWTESFRVLPRVQTPEDRIAHGFRFTLKGPTNRVYILERSGDLSDWVPFLTNRLLQVEEEFRDPGATSADRRYYRAVLAP